MGALTNNLPISVGNGFFRLIQEPINLSLNPFASHYGGIVASRQGIVHLDASPDHVATPLFEPVAGGTGLEEGDRIDGRAGAAHDPKRVDGEHELIAPLFGAGFGQGLQ